MKLIKSIQLNRHIRRHCNTGLWFLCRCWLCLHPCHFWAILGFCPPMDRVSGWSLKITPIVLHTWCFNLFGQVHDSSAVHSSHPVALFCPLHPQTILSWVKVFLFFHKSPSKSLSLPSTSSTHSSLSKCLSPLILIISASLLNCIL